MTRKKREKRYENMSVYYYSMFYISSQDPPECFLFIIYPDNHVGISTAGVIVPDCRVEDHV
jgi:hypothetical protein